VHLVYFTGPEAHVPRIQNAEIYTGIPVIRGDITVSASKQRVDKIFFFNIIIFFLLQNYFYWFRDPSSHLVGNGGSFHR